MSELIHAIRGMQGAGSQRRRLNELKGPMEPSNDFLDRARDSTLVENTAQAVFKHLDRLEDHRTTFGARWVWELLQNARDAAPREGVSVEIIAAGNRLEFRHDGVPFQSEEVAHLIYHGSTKVGSDEDLDHFGSGFLSTHLLSRIVRVRGQLTNGADFEFNLDRSGMTIEDLRRAMDRSWHDFRTSCSAAQSSDSRSTEYVYDLPPDCVDFAQDGLESLRTMGHLALAFSPEIREIAIHTDNDSWSVSSGPREHLTNEIELLRIECREGAVGHSRAIAITGIPEDVQVVLPLAERPDGLTAELDEDTPRLFILFPLITTERLPLPVVVNSKGFKPKEDRDGIVLDGDTERIAKNKELLDRSADLMLQLLAYGAEAKWCGLERLLSYDSTRLPDWVDREWFCNYLRKLIDGTRRLQLLETREGRWVAPSGSWIPSHDEPQHRETLSRLAGAWDNGPLRLPKQEHIESWYRNLRSWVQLKPEEDLPEAFTIRRLADLVHNAAKVEDLRHLLATPDDTFGWLQRLFEMIRTAGSTPLLDDLSLLPSQAGFLRKRSDLLYDEGIADDLKTIADAFGVGLQDELLDARASTPAIVELLQRKSEEDALEDVLDGLQRSCEGDRLTLGLTLQNALLFWWIARSPVHRSRLDGYPIVTADESDGLVRLVGLKHDIEHAPLAPPSLWPDSAKPFASLFPKRRMLHPLVADAHSEAASDGWTAIAVEGYVRLAPLFETRRHVQRFLADPTFRDGDDLESHRSEAEVTVSDIAFLTEDDVGLIDTARKSRTRATQLVRFLTTSVIVEDSRAFEDLTLACECGEEHSAFSAAWLTPLHDRKWVPLPNGRATLVSPESLSGLLADEPALVEKLASEMGTQLLQALGVSPADFQLRAMASEEHERVMLVRSVSELARAAGGDIQRVEMLVSEIRDHPEIIPVIEERKAQRAKVQANQRLGRLVEDLLEEALADHALIVRRTGIGSDFEIDSDFTDPEEEVWLEVTGSGTSTLVEVKSARSDRVRMTPTQARKAQEEEARFALCVVPLLDDSPSREDVRERCRFVFDIGRLLAEPWEDYLSALTATDQARHQPGNIEVEITEGQARFAVGRQVWVEGLDFQAALEEISRRGHGKPAQR